MWTNLFLLWVEFLHGIDDHSDEASEALVHFSVPDAGVQDDILDRIAKVLR